MAFLAVEGEIDSIPCNNYQWHKVSNGKISLGLQTGINYN